MVRYGDLNINKWAFIFFFLSNVLIFQDKNEICQCIVFLNKSVGKLSHKVSVKCLKTVLVSCLVGELS